MSDIPRLRPSPQAGFGRVRREYRTVDPRNGDYPLRSALRRTEVYAAPRSRSWYLKHTSQIDQGPAPYCVEATTRHWQLARPVYLALPEPFGALYAECKKIDGYPTEDGTDAHAMFKVLKKRGNIGAYLWYDGQDKQAVRDWIRAKSGLFFGVYLSQEMCMGTLPDGTWRQTGTRFNLGHEMFVNSYDPTRKRAEFGGVQSWGLDWARQGRWRMGESDFWDRVDDAGDLAGAIQLPSVGPE